MPQEGLNVFYRFFRDRISWFEADAVCQFHHANLVTVDNSFQFDATRDLLRELDVNDIVWIGLIRPQSSERFMWSNSRPLIANTGYWAESLPLMEAPLCAVIDPIRDYRWHALRCGGPETASFLCEMAVPSWADACILKDIPNLTMQYMADTASVELIRSCQEEGTLRQTCKGKQDRARIIQELVCPRERMEAQRINDITNSHFKSLQIINSVRTDNNENNDIELVPINVGNYGRSSEITEGQQQQQQTTEKNTVQRLIEQFNVDELMQADQPDTVESHFKILDEIPKPVKKIGKKYTNEEKTQKKELFKKYPEPEVLPLEDMMLGDQPQQGEPELVEHVLDDEVSNEIMEPLPHRKKILPQDLKPKLNTEITHGMSPMNTFHHLTTTTTTTTATTPTTTNLVPIISTTEIFATVGHPIHPHETHTAVSTTEDTTQTHAKDNSHFIPPMLLVKSHYIPPTKHEHEHEHEHEQHEHVEPIENSEHHVHLHALPSTSTETSLNVPTTTAAAKTTTTTSTITPKPIVTEEVTTEYKNKQQTTIIEETTTELPLVEKKLVLTENISEQDVSSSTTTTTKTVTTNLPVTMPTITTDPSTTTTTTAKSTTVEMLPSTEMPELLKSGIKTISNKRTVEKFTTKTTTAPTPIVAKQQEEEIGELPKIKIEENHESIEDDDRYEHLFASKTTPEKAEEFEAKVAAAFTAASKIGQQPLVALAPTTTSTNIPLTTTQQHIEMENAQNSQKITNVNELQTLKTITVDSNATTTTSTTTMAPIITTTTTTTTTVKDSNELKIVQQQEEEEDYKTTTRHNFLLDETTTTFKPNRRRILTKPESAGYFKKILG